MKFDMADALEAERNEADLLLTQLLTLLEPRCSLCTRTAICKGNVGGTPLWCCDVHEETWRPCIWKKMPGAGVIETVRRRLGGRTS